MQTAKIDFNISDLVTLTLWPQMILCGTMLFHKDIVFAMESVMFLPYKILKFCYTTKLMYSFFSNIKFTNNLKCIHILMLERFLCKLQCIYYVQCHAFPSYNCCKMFRLFHCLDTCSYFENCKVTMYSLNKTPRASLILSWVGLNRKQNTSARTHQFIAFHQLRKVK